MAYLDTTGFADGLDEQTVRDRLQFILADQDLSGHRFEIEYVGPPLPTPWPKTEGRYAVIRIEPE